MRISSLALIPLVGAITGVAIAVATPQPVAAEKLPVDCSGRYTDCFEQRQCTKYNAEHVCTERTVLIWHWYYSAPLK